MTNTNINTLLPISQTSIGSLSPQHPVSLSLCPGSSQVCQKIFKESCCKIYHCKKCIMVSTAQLFLTLIIIRNVSWAPNQYIRMILEGSCDPEDGSNDAENIKNKRSVLFYLMHDQCRFKRLTWGIAP